MQRLPERVAVGDRGVKVREDGRAAGDETLQLRCLGLKSIRAFA